MANEQSRWREFASAESLVKSRNRITIDLEGVDAFTAINEEETQVYMLGTAVFHLSIPHDEFSKIMREWEELQR
jgi:hypothetical protein